MRNLLLCVLVATPAACGGDDDDTGTMDTSPMPDADLSACLLDRPEDCQVDLSGQVLRMDTNEEFGGVIRVSITTGFDFDPAYPPSECPLLANLTTASDGAFGATDVSCDSNVRPPTLLVTVDDPVGSTGNEIARSVFSVPLSCPGPAPDCDATVLDLKPPRASVATTWREELGQDGVTNPTMRGLALVRFENGSGVGVDGVQPFVTDGVTETPLAARTQVRFLNSTLNTLTVNSSTTTTGSGWALVFVDGPVVMIGGTKGAMRWEPVNVIIQPNLFHVIEIAAPAGS